MNLLRKIIFLFISILCLVSSGQGMAQHDHHHETQSPDVRVAVEFPVMMKDHTLTSMRDHLLALAEIQEAIGSSQYDKAASIAENRLGLTALKSHHAFENSQFMPKEMQEIGSQMHRHASQFAVEVQNAGATGDLKLAMLALSKTTQTCVACHAGYRLK